MSKKVEITDREAKWIIDSIEDAPLNLEGLYVAKALVKKLAWVDRKWANRVIKEIERQIEAQ